MKKLSLVALLLLIGSFFGCGGSGSSAGGGNNPSVPTLQSIAVTPATPSINSVAPGNTQQFTATGTYSDGSTKNLTSLANWLSSSASVATINTSGLATGVAGGATTISAQMSGVTATTMLTVVALQSITVTPANPSVAPNGTQQFTATGNYTDSSTKNLTSSVTWNSSNTNAATITVGGLATGKTPGAQSTITATSGNISGNTILTVTNPLVSIAVTPANQTINPVAPGNTLQFTATGTYADNSQQNLTASVNWQSSNSLTTSISGGGLATGVAPGNVTISASLSGVNGSISLTVSNPLQSITVTPANPSVAPGTKPQFTATALYFDNTSPDITTQVTWSSTNTNAATISNSPGTQGLATVPVTAGGLSTTIKATCTPPSPACPTGSAVSGSTALTVKNVTIVSILVTPSNAPIALGLQQLYNALATLSDGTTQDVTNVVTWASSDTTKITITTSGYATGVAVTTSPVTISATSANNVVGSTTATVNAGNLVSIAIKPANVIQLAQGTSQQYSAIGTFTNGSTLDITNQVTWTTSAPAIATIPQRGLVRAAPTVPNATNPVTIKATLGAVSQQLNLTVTNATPTSITVTPVTATIQVGATQTFHATAVFTDGTSQDVSLNSTWTSSNIAQAKVTFPGRLLGVSTTSGGPSVTVTATFGGVSGTASLDVSTATLTSITLAPSAANLAPGSSITIQAIGTYSDSSQANLTGLATWTSNNTSVATVNNGVVLGQSAGQASVTASYQSVVGGTSNNIVVTSSPLASIAVTPTNPKTYVGVAIQLTATGTTNPPTQPINLTQSATWASSNSAVATVSNAAGRQGQATGVSPGSTAVNAVFGQITGTANPNLSVSNATITKLTITPANPAITVGTSQQFTATATFSDGKQVDVTTQVTWSSSAPNIAPITTAGLASGAVGGGQTTTITATFTQPGIGPGQPITQTDQTVLTVN